MFCYRKIYDKKGHFLIGMVLAVTLLVMILRGIFEVRNNSQDMVEQKYALEELGIVGQGVKSYLDNNRSSLLALSGFSRGNADHAVFNASSNAAVRNEIAKYMPGEKSLDNLRNIWGDSYRVIFVRTKNPASDGNSERGDSIISYVLASGKSYETRHKAGTETGDRWLQGGMRRAVMNGGAAYGFVETTNGKQMLKSGGWETDIGLAQAGAHDGDIAYLVTFNMEDMASQTLMRYPTGDDEDNTMHADLDMNDHNVLNVRHLEAQSVNTGSIKFDPTLYKSAEEAEASCRQNWFYIKDAATSAPLFVNSAGRVYASWLQNSGNYTGDESSFVGTFGMNGSDINSRIQNNGTTAHQISNVGRVYYISPTEAMIPGSSDKRTDNSRSSSDEVFAKKTQLAVCRVINGQNTLAYIGDNRSEDKISFVVSAVDGDFIPPFYCPGQDADVAGGGTSVIYHNDVQHVSNSGAITTGTVGGEQLFTSGKNTASTTNSAGIMPRLFVMPQMVSTGNKAFPIQGIRAWAETVDTNGSIAKGWIIRLNALVDIQNGDVNKRTYWIGNIPKGSQIGHSYTVDSDAGENTPGYMNTHELEQKVTDSGTVGEFSVDFLRAVVIGVCSGKASAF